MNKTLRAVISLALSVAVVFGVTASGFAADAHCDCDRAPVVFVDGIGTTLYTTDENGEEKTVFPMSSDIITSSVLEFIPAVLVSTVFGGWSSFSDTLAVFAGELFSEIDCDENGDSVLPVYAHSSDDAEVEEHTDGDNIYKFRYDWRLDPYVIAEQLDEYIDEILAVTGHEKVVLSAFSEGGEVTLAYLDAYGSSKLEKYVAQCSAFQGLTLIGEVFTNNVGVDADLLADFLVSVVAVNGADEGVIKLLNALRYIGIYSGLSGLVNKLLDNCFDDIYDVIARNMFACMPGIFGFVPADYFDEAVEMLFGDERLKYSKLIERITRYHNAQVNAESILKAVQASGTPVVLVSNYGVASLPLTNDVAYCTDTLIDSANTSGGATFAVWGETLGEGYKQKLDDGHNHLSPDGTVDASTCMLPESTWFVSGFTHWCECEELMSWIYWYDGQPTVWDNPDYPQFLVGNPTEMTVSPQ